MKQTNYKLRVWIAKVAAAAYGCMAGVAYAADGASDKQVAFPKKPVTIVVPFASGGSPDQLARILGQQLGTIWKFPVIIENKPGAGGNIAAAYVARSAPDGYTLLMGTDGPLAINQSIYATLPYDPVRDFTPIGLAASVDFVLVTANSVPANNVADFIAYSKKHDPALAYGSAGVGSQHHLGMETFRAEAGIDLRHIAYRGVAPALADVMGDHIPVMFASVSSAAPLVSTHKVKGLAVTGQQRSPLIPDVPTMKESGVQNFELSAWFGLVAPAGTSPDVVAKISADLKKVLDTPSVQAKLAADGFTVKNDTPSAFAQFIKTEHVRWAKAAKQANVTAQTQ